MVKKVGSDGATYLGPFGSRRAAEQAITAMHEATRIRQCGGRMPKNPRMSPCALAEMGRCLAPCDGHLSVEEYEVEVQRLREAISASPVGIVRSLLRRIRRLASGQRFEEASRHRDRMAAFLQAAERTQRLRPVAAAAQIVAARRREEGGYDLHVIRYGRLAAAGFAAPGTDPMPVVASLLTTAETVPAPTTPPLPAGAIEEAEILTRWLDTVGVRLISVEGELACPVAGAGSLKGALRQAYAGRDTIAYSGIRHGDSRRGRPEHRPPR
jgi:DNA polymerase-3 subunit epsilon